MRGVLQGGRGGGRGGGGDDGGRGPAGIPLGLPDGIPPMALAVGVLAALIGVLLMTCTTYVAPNEVGIRESRLIPPQGIRPGLINGGRIRFLLPGQTVHRFPTDLQVIEFADSTSEVRGIPSDRLRIEPSVEVNTSDGSKVSVDVTVLYRIVDAFTVMQQAGPGRLFESNAVIPKTIAALKKNLGEMVAEDFYDVHRRVDKQTAAQKQVAAELIDKGIAIDQVLIRQYRYNGEYQAQIEEKKIQDQLVFTRQSESEAAREFAKKQEIEATGRANVEVEKQRAEADMTKIRSEADAYQRKRAAEADLVVKLATARGTELENNAYRGGGSANLIGLEMAEVLKGLDVIVVPAGGKSGMNPLDLDQALEMWGIEEDAR
jgi:regulator of protease activity HflC (stomatin/prohibitin superfamily)